ncbi:MAG: ShlB/FhaC/HecB family hemolysin secretion/activation protein, partial [Rickettsiales bacterium]|nr:ShlB/FhaC/HecB family hemolysin secretion/activation protein [Rickettsiales bacterium]
ENNLLRTEARNQYDLVKLYAYYNTKVNIPLLTKSEVKNKDGSTMMQSVPQKDDKGNIIKDEKGNPKFELQTDDKGNLIKYNGTSNKNSSNNNDKNNNNNKVEDNENYIVKQEPVLVRNKLPLNYTLTFNTQYSWNTLYGTDQFSIGGEWTVRGFKENTISGDNGYSIRNDLRVNLQKLFPNFILNTKPMKFGNNIKGKQYNLSMNDALSRTYLSLFYDYGFITDKYGDSSDTEYNSKHGYMAGTGLALNYYGKYIDWSLTYAKALHSPNYLQSRDALKKENQSVYWRTVVKF